MKKTFSVILIAFLSLQLVLPFGIAEAAVSPQIANFLCERGMLYYDQGKYPEALTEFKKALLANPESATAKEFIGLIEGQKNLSQPLPSETLFTERSSSINSLLDKMEIKKERHGGAASRLKDSGQMVSDLKEAVISQKKTFYPGPPSQPSALNPEAPQTQVSPPEIVDIDAKLEGKDVLEVQTNIGEHLILKGKNISKFLIISPNLLKAERQSGNELLVEPLDLGSTYMHIWDDEGRKTFKFTINPRKWEENLLEAAQQRLRESNLPESFKFGYSIEGDSFYTGRGIGDLKRQSNTMAYTSSLIGETPFGNFDSAVQGSRSELGTYRVSNLRAGLTNGHYDQFKDITIRGFDFTPAIAEFGFPSSDLRGILVDAPMFNKRVHYTSFWGALPTGDFTQISSTSGLSPTKKAWLEGLNLNYTLGKFADFKGFYAHSYGPERTEPVLTSDASGFGMDYHLGRFNLDSEMAYDFLKHISFTANSSFNLPKLRIGMSLTQNDKKFASVFGGVPSSGSINGALTLNYRPTADINIFNSFTGTRDKVFGNPDRPGRPNYNSITRIDWTLDPQTELELGYTLDDMIGSNTPSVTETKEISYRKKLFFIRRLNYFFNYQNEKTKNYTSAAQNFNNNRILTGLSFRIISELYAYYRREFNILRNTFTGERSLPVAQEIGLNFYRQIFDSPFYTNLRLSYRDEEHTESSLSFLSGEDRLEGEAELTYKPNPDSETFLKVRLTNVWAEKQGVAKHFDMDLSWGMRFVWDTGLRWPSQGGFNGYVFYDINGDGIKQPREQGAKGIEVKSSDGKSAVTDALGYYKISGIVGRQAVLELNLKTLPKGYNPTTSAVRPLDIVHAKIKRVDFGITTRSEISGLVFNDKNGNGKYDAGEQSIKGVVIILDGKDKAVSTPMGEYMFRKLSPGDHTLKLDLKSIPIKFIPKVPVTKTIKVLEGASFVYNIPLQSSEPIKLPAKNKPR